MTDDDGGMIGGFDCTAKQHKINSSIDDGDGAVVQSTIKNNIPSVMVIDDCYHMSTCKSLYNSFIATYSTERLSRTALAANLAMTSLNPEDPTLRISYKLPRKK